MKRIQVIDPELGDLNAENIDEVIKEQEKVTIDPDGEIAELKGDDNELTELGSNNLQAPSGDRFTSSSNDLKLIGLYGSEKVKKQKA